MLGQRDAGVRDADLGVPMAGRAAAVAEVWGHQRHPCPFLFSLALLLLNNFLVLQDFVNSV